MSAIDRMQEELDAIALQTLDWHKQMTANIGAPTVADIDRNVETLKEIGKWFAIRKRVDDPGSSGEGSGIGALRERLENPSGGGKASDGDEADDAAESGHPARAKRASGAAGRARHAANKPSAALFEGNGGQKLSRLMARLPGDPGNPGGDLHDSGNPVSAAGGGGGSVRTDGNGAPKSDLDSLVGDSPV